MPASAGRVAVYHATSPGCHWSWGYEALFNRLELVYGDQIDVHVRIGCPYEDFAEWEKHYGMSFDEMKEWLRGEIAERTGVPLFTDLRRETIPDTMLPPSMAAFHALRLDARRGRRFARALLRMYTVEGRDIAQEDAVHAAAAEAGMEAPAILAAFSDGEKLRHDFEHQGEGFPHAPIGFYNVAVSDGGQRLVLLDYAFEPTVVEDAIDWLAGGALRKRAPTDVEAYLREHGPAPRVEIERVFAWSAKDAEVRLAALESAGSVRRRTLAGAPHWESVQGAWR
ncbi:MAG TPA: hypothetical protein VM681_07480 [Candidatus Thermoplasmatota archaeon]|nr:hypothetical protein [Candidatus Thermoplasmatota archaeon]